MSGQRRFCTLCLGLFALIFAWSAYQPRDVYTWFIEVLPVIIALPILWLTHLKFPLSRLAYMLILLHAMILMVGGHYTYAEVPLFNWLRDTFQLDRNYYDRIGHFAQGFIPAIIAREILIRQQVVKQGAWLFFVVCCIGLSISALYELIEWWVALLSAQAADAFLGTQGDVWDTQWDMLIALIGVIAAQVFLAKLHDKSMLKLEA